jgi:acetolactate synthase-1/3 small subunit
VLLVRLEAEGDARAELIAVAEQWRATTIDASDTSITFELCDHPSRLSEFLSLVEHYGVIDLVKSGRVAMARDDSAKTLTER